MGRENKVKKVRAGKYEYRGFIIQRHGYYPPEGRIIWEGFSESDLGADFHGYTLGETIQIIDAHLNKNHSRGII